MATATLTATAPSFLAPDRERMLLEQMPQVKFIARRIHERVPGNVELDDLEQAGMVGLVKAVDSYDPARNVLFKSYAEFRIRGAILDSLRELDWSPRELRRGARRVEEARLALRADLGRDATEPEIAEYLEMPLGDLQHLVGEIDGLSVGSLSQPGTATGEEFDLTEVIADPAESALDTCIRGEMKGVLAKAIGELPERERSVIGLYYHAELTMNEIAATLGVTESRVSQLRSSAIAHLRKKMQGSRRRGAQIKAAS
jgi:RNA polymerase sigma factor FliA